MNKTLLLTSFVITLWSCGGIDCDQLPNSYPTYENAVRTIEAAHFKIQETVNTSKSSWIRSASYYSCDGGSGFFIIKTDKQEYIYTGVPIDTWYGFKNAESFGRYYNHNIKHKFSFTLNQ
jgi:hypothetical protein